MKCQNGQNENLNEKKFDVTHASFSALVKISFEKLVYSQYQNSFLLQIALGNKVIIQMFNQNVRENGTNSI